MKKQYIFYLIGFIYLLVNAKAGISLYDEGITLVGGMRLINSELPYSEFWTTLPPGIFFVSAIFQIFTKSILITKFFTVIISFLTALSIDRIYHKLSDKRSILPFFTSIVILGYGLVYMNALSVGLILGLLSVIKFLDFLTTSNKKSLLFAALFISATGFFRIDFAIYLIVIQLMIIFVADEESKVNKNESLTQFLFGIMPIILTFMLIGILTGFNNFYQQIIDFPLFKSQTTDIAFPAIWGAFSSDFSSFETIQNLWKSLIFILPPVISIIGYSKFKDRIGKGNILFLGLVVLIFYNQVLSKPDFEHLLPSLLISIPTLFLLFDNSKYKKVISSTLLILILMFPFIKKWTDFDKYYLSGEYEYTELPYLDGVLVESDKAFKQKEYLTLLNSIKSKSIYIGLKNHSSFEKNNVMLYYLADILPPTKYHEFRPGLVDKEEIQTKMLKEIEVSTDYALLLDYGTKEDDEGSNILDYYFRKYYQPIIRKEDYLFLAKSNFTELR